MESLEKGQSERRFELVFGQSVAPAATLAARAQLGSPPTTRAAYYSDCIQLPGDIVGDPPEIANFGLADQGIGAPLMPPIK